MTENRTKRFLHAGCGSARKDRTTAWFASDEWEELRLDISPACKPDLVGNIVGLEGIADGEFDAVFSSHNIEHLYAHEVPAALAAFCRVLRPGGHLVIACPDMQAVCAHVAEGRLLEPLYQSPSGPIAALDILYGHRASLSRGDLYMAHRCGFTVKTLSNALQSAGFDVVWMQRTRAFALRAVACKGEISREGLSELARRHFPARQ